VEGCSPESPPNSDHPPARHPPRETGLWPQQKNSITLILHCNCFQVETCRSACVCWGRGGRAKTNKQNSQRVGDTVDNKDTREKLTGSLIPLFLKKNRVNVKKYRHRECTNPKHHTKAPYDEALYIYIYIHIYTQYATITPSRIHNYTNYTLSLAQCSQSVTL